MGIYGERGPAGGDRKAPGIRDGVGSGHITRIPEKEQRESLSRLLHFRGDLNRYCESGGYGEPPHPRDYGLQLGTLSSSEIFWPPL